jgi:hypothetical protein
MKLIATLLVAAAVSGFQLSDNLKSSDGYQFSGKEFNNTDTKIEFVIHPSYRDLRQSAQENGIKNSKSVMAFSTLNGHDYKQCVVHIIDPNVVYAPEYIGHEIVHCIYGRWHDKPIVMAARKK